MRRLATGVLVIALAALALAAAFDAVRWGADEGPRADAALTPDAAAEATVALREAGASGTLMYSDEDCTLHALRLPQLERAPAPGFRSCEPHIPSGGFGVLDGEVVWSGLGYQTVQVVLSRADLTRAVQGDADAASLAYGGAGRFEATQLVGLGKNGYAVVLDHEQAPWERLLAVFEGRRLVSLRIGLVGPDDVVRPSSTGRYFALVRPHDIRVFETRGGAMPLPSASQPHAVTWSPDDRWTALATRHSVYIFPTHRPDETIRIPVSARDLEWGP